MHNRLAILAGILFGAITLATASSAIPPRHPNVIPLCPPNMPDCPFNK